MPLPKPPDDVLIREETVHGGGCGPSGEGVGLQAPRPDSARARLTVDAR